MSIKDYYEQTRTQGRLEHRQGKAEKKFAQLTDNDLRYEEGQEDELVGRLQRLTGRTRSEVEAIVRESFEA